jgi:hypothetical protein
MFGRTRLTDPFRSGRPLHDGWVRRPSLHCCPRVVKSFRCSCVNSAASLAGSWADELCAIAVLLIHAKVFESQSDNTCRSRGSAGEPDMDIGWILLGVVGWILLTLMALILLRMAGDQDRAARLAEKRIVPYSDITITRYGVR